MIRHHARTFGQHAARPMRNILWEGSQDFCEFQSGRLTPWIFKVRISAKWSRLSRKNPRYCPARCPWPHPVCSCAHSKSMPASRPRPRPQFVSVRAQSTSATYPQTCPCPIRDRAQSESRLSPFPVHSRILSASAHVPGKSKKYPSHSAECPPLAFAF